MTRGSIHKYTNNLEHKNNHLNKYKNHITNVKLTKTIIKTYNNHIKHDRNHSLQYKIHITNDKRQNKNTRTYRKKHPCTQLQKHINSYRRQYTHIQKTFVQQMTKLKQNKNLKGKQKP